MIADAYGAVLAFRDISAFVTDYSTSVSFFIHQNSNLLTLGEIFFDAVACQLRKIRSDLLCHIHQKNGFLGSFDFVVKTFVIHSIIYLCIGKKEESLNRKVRLTFSKE